MHWSNLHCNSAASFKLGVPRPLKAFQRMLGLMASASWVLQLGLLHMPRCSSGPLEEPSVDGTGRAPGHGLQKEGGLDRHLQLRLGGGAVRRQTGLQPLVKEGRLPSHQLPGNAGNMFGPSHLSARPDGTSGLRVNPISLSYPFPFVLPLALVPRNRVVRINIL